MAGRFYKKPQWFIPETDRHRRLRDGGAIWINDIPILMLEIPKRIRQMGIREFMDALYKSGFFGNLPLRETVWHLMAEAYGEPKEQAYEFDFKITGSGSTEPGDMLDELWQKKDQYIQFCVWLYKRRGFTERHRAEIVKLSNELEMLRKLSAE